MLAQNLGRSTFLSSILCHYSIPPDFNVHVAPPHATAFMVNKQNMNQKLGWIRCGEGEGREGGRKGVGWGGSKKHGMADFIDVAASRPRVALWGDEHPGMRTPGREMTYLEMFPAH